ncbi:MAG TPA: sodium:solute symporter family protein [Candidatus Avacidaminococcus intestinavium]|uniref:Sodium:solute symporter family protein n=1 Tax=Candidatus Avacidaminococcus intestinavium TaxID=2840684 RepID=A0A9D1SLU8_9FIRM|nr:sodium:solute symporter family protein [Candidatus Avacidaminococcus intestinavium]
MNISLVIIILYIIGLFAISWYAKKRSEGSSENYALAGRKLSAPLIGVSIIGLAVGGASTIGVSEHAFKVGLSAGWYTAAWGFGAIVMGLIMAKKYREANIVTVSELIERYYDKKAVVLGVVCQIIIQLVIISLQYIAGGSILSAIMPEIDFEVGVFLTAVTFIGITFIGGMWSASLSNILSIVVIYGGIAIATVIQYDKVGGIAGLTAKLPTDIPWFDPLEGVGIVGIISWIVVLITVNLSLQSIVQISLSAKSAEVARKGFIWGGLMMIPVGFMSALLGICAKASYPEAHAAMALPQVIVELQPVISGITLAALWAADVSTACNLLISAGTLFSKDIYKRYINKDASDLKQVLVMKGSIVFAGLITVGMAMMVSGILNTIMIGLSLTAAFSVIVIIGLFFPQYTCKAAGFNTLLVGLIVLILWQLVPAVRVFPHVIYMEWVACLGTYLLTAILVPNKKKFEEKVV